MRRWWPGPPARSAPGSGAACLELLPVLLDDADRHRSDELDGGVADDRLDVDAVVGELAVRREQRLELLHDRDQIGVQVVGRGTATAIRVRVLVLALLS